MNLLILLSTLILTSGSNASRFIDLPKVGLVQNLDHWIYKLNEVKYYGLELFF